MVTETGAWATAVLVSAHSGFLVTNAHLIEERRPQHSQQAMPAAEQSSSSISMRRLGVQLWMRLRPAGALQQQWCTARVIYAFQGPLDLAVLQLEDSRALLGVQELQLCSGEWPSVTPGQPIAVLGFPLLAPRNGLGPCATAGIAAKVRLSHVHAQAHAPVHAMTNPDKFCCNAQVVHGEALGVPAMLMTNATVHPGMCGAFHACMPGRKHAVLSAQPFLRCQRRRCGRRGWNIAGPGDQQCPPLKQRRHPAQPELLPDG